MYVMMSSHRLICLTSIGSLQSDLGDPPNMICPLSPAPVPIPAPVTMPKPVCPPRRGKGYDHYRTEYDDDYSGKGGKGGTVKKDRRDSSGRTMQMFSDRSLRAHYCPEYDDDHQEGKGKASYRRVMKKSAEKSEKAMYHLDDDEYSSGGDGKGMKQ